jgi:hypothetical protein
VDGFSLLTKTAPNLIEGSRRLHAKYGVKIIRWVVANPLAPAHCVY